MRTEADLFKILMAFLAERGVQEPEWWSYEINPDGSAIIATEVSLIIDVSPEGKATLRPPPGGLTPGQESVTKR